MCVCRTRVNGHKLLCKWHGASRITVLYEPIVCEFECLLGDNSENVDCVRLQKGCDANLDVEVTSAGLGREKLSASDQSF